jgi:hypothetical protein
MTGLATVTGMQLTRLDMVDDVEALGLAGAGPEVFGAGGADVAVGSGGIVIIADAGDDLAASGVRNRTGPSTAPAISQASSQPTSKNSSTSAAL